MKRTGATIVALFLFLTLLAPQSARADANTDAADSAATWIENTWKQQPGKFSSAGTVADGIIALSAANKKPDTVRAMLVDLKKRGPEYSNGFPAGLAKMIMTADIAGQNPRTLFGCNRDLVAELKAVVATGRVDSREYWGPYLIAIALSRAGEQVPDWVIDAMASSQQQGGFGYIEGGKFLTDPDYTALGISAMNHVANNTKNTKHHQRAHDRVGQAIGWSKDAKNQQSDAAGYYWATYSSANSTGMLASALSEVGEDVTGPVLYLRSQQNGDGGWAAAHKKPGETPKSNVRATTQAVLGVIGDGYGTARSTQVPDLANCNATPQPPVKPTPPETVYNTPGDKTVNGRNWRTTCEPYSRTTRCRTLIEATTVDQVSGRFVVSKGYVFNNLTYLPSSRSLWNSNPLGGNGKIRADVSWTAADGRTWRTECDTALTGRNGCRTFATARVIETITRPGQTNTYRWVTKEIFNNMVQFS